MLPTGAGDVSCVQGNFDGAGTEPLAVFALAAERQPWRAVVVLKSGLKSQVTLPTAKQEHAVTLGVDDADNTGRDVAFIQVQMGASTTFDALYRVADHQLQPVLLADGRPAVFAHGGSVTHQNAYGCLPQASGGPELVTLGWTATNATGTSFEVTRIVYHWREGMLVASTPVQSTSTSTVPGQPAVPEFSTLRCGSRASSTD